MPAKFPDTPLHGPSQGEGAQIDPAIDEAVKKYGSQTVRDAIAAYASRVENVHSLNTLLASLSESRQPKDDERYFDIVRKIMAATQAYYDFIGDQPEDLRQMLLTLANSTEDADYESLRDMGILVDNTIHIDPGSLISAQAIRPRNYTMQIDAITNQLAFLELDDVNQLRVGSRGSQPVLTTVTLDIPEHLRIEGGGTLSTYDKSIINGVTSLMESGNTVFTIPMLYHAMTGKQNPTVDEGLYGEISGKLEKMRRMMLTIDLTEENEAHYITDKNGETIELRDLTIEGYLLPLNRVRGMINGQPAELYQIIQHPPLYAYSKMRRQLATVEISLLGAPVNNNATTIPLKTYLLQRIEMMKNANNRILQSKILYDSVYQELGAEETNKTRKMRIRKYTTTILDYFVSKGYITGYVEYKKGRSIAGLDIYL